MNNKKEKARKNFQTLLKGKTPPRVISTAEAKARLRATDPDIDIGRPLHCLNQGRIKQAGVALSIEIATTATFSYLRPLVNFSLLGLAGILSEKQKNY